MTVGEPTSYDTTVGTFGKLGRALADDINKVFVQTDIPSGKYIAQSYYEIWWDDLKSSEMAEMAWRVNDF